MAKSTELYDCNAAAKALGIARTRLVYLIERGVFVESSYYRRERNDGRQRRSAQLTLSTCVWPCCRAPRKKQQRSSKPLTPLLVCYVSWALPRK